MAWSFRILKFVICVNCETSVILWFTRMVNKSVNGYNDYQNFYSWENAVLYQPPSVAAARVCNLAASRIGSPVLWLEISCASWLLGIIFPHPSTHKTHLLQHTTATTDIPLIPHACALERANHRCEGCGWLRLDCCSVYDCLIAWFPSVSLLFCMFVGFCHISTSCRTLLSCVRFSHLFNIWN